MKTTQYTVREARIISSDADGMRLTYSTEEEFRQMLAEFRTWNDLHLAGFPAVKEELPDAAPADWRTSAERAADLSRATADIDNGMEAMWPLSQFEPTATTLADLKIYQEEQYILAGKIHEGHVAAIAKRDGHLDRLIAAAEGDLTMTWQTAEDRLADV